VNFLDYSPDGSLPASGPSDKSIRIWKVDDGSLLSMSQQHSDSLNAVTFSSDGSFLASASKDQSKWLWRISDGALLYSQKSIDSDAVFSPDGSILAGVCGEEIILWKYAEGKLITLRGHTKEVDSIAFSPDGLLLASGSWDATVRFWRVSDGEQLRTLENVTGWVTDLSFSSDGVLLASGSGDGTIYLWGIAP
jgi:WD40 repeat protein